MQRLLSMALSTFLVPVLTLAAAPPERATPDTAGYKKFTPGGAA